MNRQLIRSVLVLFLICFSLVILPQSALASFPNNERESTKRMALHDAMRKLWAEHVFWTRVFIISAVADLPDKGFAPERLLQNQVEIGNAIKPYYGDAAGDKLTTLLKEHVITAAEIVAAARAGDKPKQEDATKRWFANADQIAAFLSDANPRNWPRTEMQQMMREHLNLTITEVVARLQGNWAADIAAFDKVHEQILHMADMLTEGIVKQYPAKFKR
ncbi:MAG: hypothetical protein QOD75_2757 [Blastocatellia bacterium]|jgi:hypothetical protein|nr:hypothetical protein [Blastocatellia bacterium]